MFLFSSISSWCASGAHKNGISFVNCVLIVKFVAYLSTHYSVTLFFGRDGRVSCQVLWL